VAKVVSKPPPVANRHYRYPWDEWLDGRTWELTAGVDFDCDVLTVVSAARQAANRRGGFANVVTHGGNVYVTFTKASEE
jgi:hypothetical protein